MTSRQGPSNSQRNFFFFFAVLHLPVALGLSLVVASKVFIFAVGGLLLLQRTISRRKGFSSCGLVALQNVDSSQTRDQTSVPSIGRQIPTHCTTREVLKGI